MRVGQKGWRKLEREAADNHAWDERKTVRERNKENGRYEGQEGRGQGFGIRHHVFCILMCNMC